MEKDIMAKTIPETENKKDKTSAITFEPNKAKELAEKLLEGIQKTGFNSMSKNDFYDFVLYLLDKYSEERFLLNNSNYVNSHLLKAKPEKIKSSKLNRTCLNSGIWHTASYSAAYSYSIFLKFYILMEIK